MKHFFRSLAAAAAALLPLMAAGCGEETGGLDRFAGPPAPVASPSSEGSSLPHLWSGPEGRVFLSWVEKGPDGNTLKYSAFSESGWSAPRLIATGSNWFVNWADYPQVASAAGGAMVSCVLRMSSESTYSYDIALASSTDGVSWRDAGLLHDDSTKTEHGFVSFAPDSGGIVVAWLDGREMAGTEGHGDDHGAGAGAMTLRAATIDQSGKKTGEWILDSRVCECCQTGIAVSSAGPVVVYRDRSETEVRDISVVRFVAGSDGAGGKWTSPVTLSDDGWEIDGCPVNGPRIAASGMTVAVAWFTAPSDRPIVKAAFSTDGGATFGAPVIVDSGEVLGRVDVVLTDEKTAVVSWIGGNSIRARALDAGGRSGPVITIAPMNGSRASGFPQMAALPRRLVFAWTDAESGSVRTAALPY